MESPAPASQPRYHNQVPLTLAEELADRLTIVSLQNINKAQYIPEGQLDEILTSENIRICLEQSKISPNLWDDCIAAVESGGRRVFAILILVERMLFLDKFVGIDGSHIDLHLDAQLPLPNERLVRLLGSQSKAKDFYKRQWEVLAPVFDGSSIHRTYDKDTILPFTRPVKELGDGAFGVVSMITLPNTQHRFENIHTEQGSVYVVRKTLKLENTPCGPEDQESQFRNEQHILMLLRTLRHPNIVRILASFTIEAEQEGELPTHNFLFPVADHSLSDLLKQADKTAWNGHFPTAYSIFSQLYGLLSAINSFHNFVLSKERYELEFIGCHCDLSPRNILISNGILLLADFGLSRLRKENSKSTFKYGQGDHLAPECEPVRNGNFSKGIISRPSDIWSLACIILEIITYHEEGLQSIKEFSELREKHGIPIVVSNVEYGSTKFHAGGKINYGVTQWLQRLKDRTRERTELFCLLESMLKIEPVERPSSKEVASVMFRVAGRIVCGHICATFKSLEKRVSFLAIRPEQQKFLLWAYTAGLLPEDDKIEIPQVTDDHNNWLRGSDSRFGEINIILSLIRQELIFLQDVLANDAHTAWPFYLKLESLVNQLWNFLPEPLIGQLMSLLQTGIIDSDDHEILIRTWQSLDERPGYENIARLAALKYVTAVLEQNLNTPKQDKLIRFRKEIPSHQIGMHYFSTLPESEEGPSRTVLVEYLNYSFGRQSDHWNQLTRRAHALALLHSGQTPDGSHGDMPEGFRILKCIGYFHAQTKYSFGLMYDFPRNCPQVSQPVTLKELIQAVQRPELGALFKLANAIVSCVSRYHSMEWVHKNISAHNIVFFNSEMSNLVSSPATEPSLAKFESHLQVETPKAASSSSSKNVRAKRSFFKIGRGSKNAGTVNASTSLMKEDTPRTSYSSKNDSFQEIDSPRPALGLQNELNNPYLVGFNYSREDKNDAFTTRTSPLPGQTIYQHPEYQVVRPDLRFHAKYDYYSTGLILLELGMWRTVEELAPNKVGTDAQLAWLSTSVPRLGSLVGNTYQGVVRACLEGRLESKEIFDSMVVKQLERCFA